MRPDEASLASVLLSGDIWREQRWIGVRLPPVPAPEATLRGAARWASAQLGGAPVSLRHGGLWCENEAPRLEEWLLERQAWLLAGGAAEALRACGPAAGALLLECDERGKACKTSRCAVLHDGRLAHFSRHPNAAAAARALRLAPARLLNVRAEHPELAAAVAALRGSKPLARSARREAARLLAAPGAAGAPWPPVARPKYATLMDLINSSRASH